MEGIHQCPKSGGNVLRNGVQLVESWKSNRPTFSVFFEEMPPAFFVCQKIGDDGD